MGYNKEKKVPQDVRGPTQAAVFDLRVVNQLSGITALFCNLNQNANHARVSPLLIFFW